MFNSTIKEELDRANQENLEVEVIIEGRTIFPSLMVELIDNDCVGFYDSEGSKVTILTEYLTGVIVRNRQPQWLNRELNLAGGAKQPATAGAR